MIALIFPHQLFEDSPLFKSGCNKFMLIEEFLFFNQYPFHKQKLIFHRASMLQYASFLEEKGYEVIYWGKKKKESSKIENIVQDYIQLHHNEIVLIDPVDDYLNQRIHKSAKYCGIKLKVYESPMFLNTKGQNEAYFKKDKKKFHHANFYTKQRITLDLLLEGGQNPVGGKWSFDADNRKKYPKNKEVPTITKLKLNSFYKEALDYVQEKYPNNYGSVENLFVYPTTFKQAKNWLEEFLEVRFNEFGLYEDAILEKEVILNHSLLSPLLNVGLLTPNYVIEQIIKHYTFDNIPLNSTEGLIRQIIGWREFVRGLYEAKGREERTRNYFNFKRKIPKSFYNGTTGIHPIDNTIQKVLTTGYCHHIERLMVLGNFMLLCEFDPNEVYQWFMELFIDAYDWVMVTNVYGMSQFADGGLMASKPYISSSNYVLKMSDYKKGEWQQVWDGLFWRFMHEQKDKLGSNPRLGMLFKTYNNMNAEKKEVLLNAAENFLKQLNDAILI